MKEIQEERIASTFGRLILLTSLLFCLIIVGPIVTPSQSSIFNTPSTDTQVEKTFYLEADYFAHFASSQNGGFHSAGPSIVYGLRKDLEIGVNFYYLREDGNTTTEIQPNIKWKVYENKKNGIAVSAGAIGFIPLSNASGTSPSAMIYLNASKTIDRANGLKVTGGIYQMINSEHDETKTGLMIGLQQPITKKLSLLADWSSGNNRFGYSSAGFGYEVNRSQYFGMGYSFGNSGRGNNYFTAFYGFTF